MEPNEKEAVKSKKDTYLEGLKGRRPDVNMDDDESLWGAINDDTDDALGRLSRQEEIDRSMTDRFENDPNFGGFFLDAIGGKSPVISLLERYGDDIRTYLDDPEKAEELAEATKSYTDRITKEKEMEEMYQTNLKASIEVSDALESEGYTSEQVDAAFEEILADAQRAILGEITREMLETKLKGMNYDNDIAEVEQVAEVRGKNTKIEEKLKNMDDGKLPPMIDGKGSGHTEKKGNSKEVDALDRLTNKPDIWQGMKRSRIS